MRTDEKMKEMNIKEDEKWNENLDNLLPIKMNVHRYQELSFEEGKYLYLYLPR